MEKDKQEKQEVKLPKPILVEDLGMLYATEKSKQKYRYGLYKCGFCGTKFKADTYNIDRGRTKSCGCYQNRRVSETNTKHGLINTRLYNIWANIKARILNPKDKAYNDYGGRGITICDEWKNDFKVFYDWAMSNGYSDELSIDRIDNDGGYSPENCRWVTSTIQSRNKRKFKNNTSGFKGVFLDKTHKKYRAQIMVNKKKINLGYFQTAVEGAVAYNNYIIENNLDGYNLNKIPEGV